MMNIPFSPPDISELEVSEVAEALRSGWITTGPRRGRRGHHDSLYIHCERLCGLSCWCKAGAGRY